VLPAYGGAALDGVVPAILGRSSGVPDWMPDVVAGASQVVLLALDGLGWEQLKERAHLAPALTAMAGGAITTVVPSTTATALTSLTTGSPPSRHGVVGYRVRVRVPGVGDEVLNVLRWRTQSGDARETVRPASFASVQPFAGTHPPVVTRSEFADSGFTGAHLAGTRLVGWRMPSTLVVTVRELLRQREPFVYAYYDGVDKVAHEFGIGEAYDAELAATDRLVADLLDVLPAGAVLVVASDHGQVDVGDRVVPLDRDLAALTVLLSGEGRFRWLHARPGMVGRVADAARALYGDIAWVRTRREIVDGGWFGGPLTAEAADRLGDVCLVAYEPVAFLDPGDTGEVSLRSRHGSLTPAEMWVPLLAGTR
jgi:predicted AlkP superfamily pyrophosphatase or phosphodiesterase